MRFVALACALCAGMPAALAVTPARGSTQATAQLAFAGWDDQVGEWWQTTPDGFRDGHFTLTLTGAGSVVARVRLNPVLPDGTTTNADWWDTSYTSGHWPLGVSRNGARLNLAFEPLCDPVGADPAVYELYAEDEGGLNNGTNVRATILFADGQSTTADATIPAAATTTLARAPRPFTFPSVPRPDANAACVASGPATVPTTSTATTTTTTTSKPPAKKRLPLCKKSQKSTAKKPCRTK